MKKLVLALLLCMALTGFAYADLVVGYGFDGDLSDSSENVYDGISSGEGVSFTEGVIGQCLLLDDGGYVDVPLPFEANPFSGDNDFSFVAWVRQPDTEGQAGLITSCKENPDEEEEHPMLIAYNLDPEEEEVGPALVYDNSWVAGVGWEGEVDIGDGQWHHYAITYESDTRDFIAYLDGEAVVTESMYPECDTADNIVRIGQSIHWDPPSQWYGVIDELGIYNHTLSEEEILTVMEEGFGTVGPVARNPIPANKYIYAPLDTDLSWDPPKDEIIGITYDVYFGTEPNELKDDWYGNNQIAAGISDTTVSNSVLDPVLDYETWYYWRVDTWDPNEGVPQLYEGREWSFRTAPFKVVIVGQPQDAVVPEGEDAEFTVEAVNAETYQWYYSATPDGAGTLLTGETAYTLVVPNVQLADEGYYYCEVMNTAMPDATSDRARLLTERMMAHWKLDKDLKDEVSSLNDGSSPMTMKYSTDGIDGSAAQIEEPDRYIIIDNNIGTFPGVTVSAWINPSDTAGWHIIIDALHTGDNNVSLFQEDDLLMGEVLGSGWVEGAGVVVGEWQHAALVCSTADEVLQLYLNGELIGEDDAHPDTWAEVGPLTMGAYVDVEDPNNPTPIDHFVGLLDDVRIYNYALSCVQVATLYTAEGFMDEEEVCCVEYGTDLSGPEDVPDCIVDVYDLAAFVEDWWLKRNIVPDCAFELP